MKHDNTKHRDFLKVTVAGVLALTFLAFMSCAGPEQPAPPNILWLISEDTSPDIACYGNPDVLTPNIDRLAAEGRRFTRTFATNPVCSPSRSAFMTGMYQTTIGAHQHRTKPKVKLH